MQEPQYVYQDRQETGKIKPTDSHYVFQALSTLTNESHIHSLLKYFVKSRKLRFL